MDGYWLQNSLMQNNQAIKWKPKRLLGLASLSSAPIEPDLNWLKSLADCVWLFRNSPCLREHQSFPWKRSHGRASPCFQYKCKKKEITYKNKRQWTQHDGIYDLEYFSSAAWKKKRSNFCICGYQHSIKTCLTKIKAHSLVLVQTNPGGAKFTSSCQF